jgi:hypothetical protein
LINRSGVLEYGKKYLYHFNPWLIGKIDYLNFFWFDVENVTFEEL